VVVGARPFHRRQNAVDAMREDYAAVVLRDDGVSPVWVSDLPLRPRVAFPSGRAADGESPRECVGAESAGEREVFAEVVEFDWRHGDRECAHVLVEPA
jgi:hypothetical protein